MSIFPVTAVSTALALQFGSEVRDWGQLPKHLPLTKLIWVMGWLCSTQTESLSYEANAEGALQVHI